MLCTLTIAACIPQQFSSSAQLKFGMFRRRHFDTWCVALQLAPDLMPDALHPNAEGMELLAQCMQPYADNYLTA